MCDAINPHPQEDVKEYLFYEAIKLHKDIKTSIEHYERIEGEEPKHADRSFEYLLQTIKRKVEKDRMDKVRDARSEQVKKW